MTNIIKYVLLTAIVLYLIFSFSQTDFNIKCWTEGSRNLYQVLMIITYFISCLIGYVLELHKKDYNE